MKVEIKEIVDQVTDLLRSRDYGPAHFNDGYKVAVCQENERIVGWVIVKVNDDGTITPQTKEFKTLVDVFDNWYKQEYSNATTD